MGLPAVPVSPWEDGGHQAGAEGWSQSWAPPAAPPRAELSVAPGSQRQGLSIPPTPGRCPRRPWLCQGWREPSRGPSQAGRGHRPHGLRPGPAARWAQPREGLEETPLHLLSSPPKGSPRGTRPCRARRSQRGAGECCGMRGQGDTGGPWGLAPGWGHSRRLSVLVLTHRDLQDNPDTPEQRGPPAFP